MKVAIVHDWLTNFGGAERVILSLHELFPEAPIYTLVYDESKMGKYFKGLNIKTSFVQNIPFGLKHYRAMLPLMPAAFEDFDFSEYDLVLSSSSSCAKGVRVGIDTLHICYCHTPMRYAWDMYNDYVQNFGNFKRILTALFMNYIRMWDKAASDRVDYFIANSNYVGKRIKKFYGRDFVTINPPVKTNSYIYNKSVKIENFYLIVSRLVPYKKVDMAVNVFNDLGIDLIIIGSGPEKVRLMKKSNKNIKFIEGLFDNEICLYYQKCKALIFGANEDFGIVPVEVQACGRPVIAYGKGGVCETVINDRTGIFYYEQNEKSLKDAVLRMEEKYMDFDSELIRKNAENFSEEKFKNKILSFIKEKVN